MEVTIKDIEEFAETANETDLRKFVVITAQILGKMQMKALQGYFARPIVLTLPKGKAPLRAQEAPVLPEEDDTEAEVEGDNTEDVLKAAREVVETPEPSEPDFGIPLPPRARGRPPQLSPREIAEKEFDEIIRRKREN